MAGYLESKGFRVLLLIDPDALNLKSSMVLFENKILRGSTVVVYFVGHGICTTFGGQHFLLPANFRPPPPPPAAEAGVELPIPGAVDSEFASQLASPSKSNMESINHKYLIHHVSSGEHGAGGLCRTEREGARLAARRRGGGLALARWLAA